MYREAQLLEPDKPKGRMWGMVGAAALIVVGAAGGVMLSRSRSTSSSSTSSPASITVPSSTIAEDGESDGRVLRSELDDSGLLDVADQDDGSTQDIWFLGLGDCWNSYQEDQPLDIEIVDCDGPHDFEVYWAYEMVGVEFPGGDKVLEDANAVCAEQFEGATGVAYLESPLDFQTLFPTESTWVENNDREVLCSVVSDGSAQPGVETDSDPDLDGGLIDVFSLVVGDCFSFAAVEGAVEDVVLLSCDAPHDSELFALYEVEGDGFPGETELDELSFDLCVEGFEEFVQFDYFASEFYMSFLTPGQDSWAQGDRVVQCVIVSSDGSKITRSAEGAAS